MHSFRRPAIAKGLILTFITLLGMPGASFANNRSSKNAAPNAPLATTIIVNLSTDADALNPAASCDTDAATPGDQCTLRSAIQHANELAGDDEINFNIPSSQPLCDPSVNRCQINLTKALPNLSTNIRIVSPGIDLIVIHRNSTTDFGIFRVTLGSDVTLSRLRIENGRPFGINAGGAVNHEGTGIVNVVDSILTDNTGGTIVSSGGAIANSSTGTLNVINSVIANNRVNASGGGLNNGSSGTMNVIGSAIVGNIVNVPVSAGSVGNGGGISNSGSGTLNITNSVIAENAVRAGDGTSVMRGGGVMNVGNGTINITGSVIHDNFVQKQGGGISNTSGTLNVTNSTITANQGVGGGVFGQGTFKSSIVAKNNIGPFSGSDVSGNFTSEGFNLVGVQEGSTGFTAPTDLKGTIAAPLDPKLDPNMTEVTFPNFPRLVPGMPLCGSPAIDKGTSNGHVTDIRGAGFPRVIDDPNESNASDGADVGAFERQVVCAQVAFTVNNTTDADDANPGDGNCDSDAVATGSQCSLRAAMKEANAVSGDYTINFAIPTNDPGFDPATGRHTINLGGPLPQIDNSNLIFNGPGKDKLTIRRNSGGFYRIFTFNGVVETATFNGLTVSNGFNSVTEGGALAFTGKNLNINSCVFRDNIAASSGGAMFVSAQLTITDSTFHNNFSSGTVGPGGGGAIFVHGGLTVTNSSFTDNVSSSLGGAINSASLTGNGDSTITNSLFQGNSAGSGGGLSVANSGVVVRVINSKFTRNIASNVNSGGGGIYIDAGTLHVTGTMLTANDGYGLAADVGNGSTTTVITDSTISGNTRGGILVEQATVATGKLNVTNSTISGNNGGPGINLFRVTLNVSNSTITNNEGGGLKGNLTSGVGTWTVKSSIIAQNGTFSDLNGAFTSAGFNLIGNPGTSTGFVNGANNDQVGSPGAPLDPKLDPVGLKDNGGPTHTIALQADSPAIDKGSAAGLLGNLANDQRQVFARTFDNPAIANAADGADVGAFELQPGGPSPTPTPTPTPSPSPSPSPSPNPSPSPTPSPAPSPSPTPTPTPAPAKLEVTVTPLVRSNCGSIALGVIVKNTGGVTASNVRLTTGTLVQPTTNGTPLPQSLGNLAPGQSVTSVLTFSGTNNPAKQKRTLTVGGTHGGGSFSEQWKVTLP